MTSRICEACQFPMNGYCREPDPCVGYLPGVYNACCGHGDPRKAYVCFGFAEDAVITLRDEKALHVIRVMRAALGGESNPSWHGGHN